MEPIPAEYAVPIAAALVSAVGALAVAYVRARDKLDAAHRDHAKEMRELHGEHIETTQAIVPVVVSLQKMVDRDERNRR